MNTIGSSRLHSLLRTGRPAVAVAGIFWALCLPPQAAAQGGSQNRSTITCSSDNGQRRYCDADTRSGVRLIRQISGSGCGPSTWGYDDRGVWVDRGCQAEFDLSGNSGDRRDRGDSQTRTIGSGTSISVRNNETINVRRSDGRVFSGVVYQDVIDENGEVAIPRGSIAELIVRDTANRDLALDLESVDVNGQRYAVITNAYATDGGRRDSLGTNTRTGEFLGGGALVGAIIGAIAGGGKGAAIGAAAGAGAGAGTQLLTRGSTVRIPAESLLTFRLEQPLEMGAPDNGFTRGGYHYHNQNQYQDQNR
jgi:hypothetical protein